MKRRKLEYLRPKPAARSPVNRAVAIASPPNSKGSKGKGSQYKEEMLMDLEEPGQEICLQLEAWMVEVGGQQKPNCWRARRPQALEPGIGCW